MTPRQIALVQLTWRSVLPIRDTFAELFYGKLLSLDARLAPLFGGDATEQGRSLAAMLSIFVRNLSQPDHVQAALHGLARRHAAYGVKPADYETFGTALLWTLSHGLGEAFDLETEEAWRQAYRLLAGTMET